MRGLAVVLVLWSCGDAPREKRDAASTHDAAVVPSDTGTDGAPDGATNTLTDASADAAPVDAAADAYAPMIMLVTCPAIPAAIVGTSGQAFFPQQTTIVIGDVVRFEPSSSHDVVAGTPQNPAPTVFQVDGGVPRCYRFGEAGAFPFFCSIHANMTGVIHVGS